MSKWIPSLLIAAAALFCTPAQAAHTLNATWLVTYYLDPMGAPGGTECVVFGHNHSSNGVVTGTWTSPTFPSWKGQWVERGQHYAWHGFYTKSGSTVATYDVGDFITATATAETSFGTFTDGAGGPTTLTTGTATMVQVNSCSGMPLHRGQDPF